MLFGRLIKKIKQKLRPKEYIVKTESPEEWRRTIPKAVSRELARLEGEVERLRRENERLRKLLEARLSAEEEALVREAHRLEQRKKAEAERKTIKIEFKFPKPVIITSAIGHEPFRGGDGELYKFWRGIELSYTPKGTYVSLLLSKRPKDKKFGKLGSIPFDNFLSLFENPHALVNDLKLGMVKVMLTPDGKFIPPKLPCYSIEGGTEGNAPSDPPDENPSDEKKQKKKAKETKKVESPIVRVKEIDTSEFIRTRDPETVGTVLAAWDFAQQQINERYKASIVEKQALLDKIEAELVAESYRVQVDRLGSLLKAALDKLDVLTARLAETKMLETDARMKQTIAEGVVKAQWEAIRGTQEQIRRLGLPAEERVRRNVERDFTFATDKVMEILGIAQGLTPIIKKEEKR